MHSIKVEKLEKTVLQVINLHINLLIDTDKIIKEANEIKTTKNDDVKKIIISKQNEISKISNLKQTLYEDWKNEYITKEEYLDYKKKYQNDIERLEKNIKKLQTENKKCEKQKANDYIEKFKKQKCITELSRYIMLELIDNIFVHENGDITIKFKFKNELKD